MLYYEDFLKSYAVKHGIELTSEIIKSLDNYNPRELYRLDENDIKLMTFTQHRIETGKISKLIQKRSKFFVIY